MNLNKLKKYVNIKSTDFCPSILYWKNFLRFYEKDWNYFTRSIAAFGRNTAFSLNKVNPSNSFA